MKSESVSIVTRKKLRHRPCPYIAERVLSTLRETFLAATSLAHPAGPADPTRSPGPRTPRADRGSGDVRVGHPPTRGTDVFGVHRHAPRAFRDAGGSRLPVLPHARHIRGPRTGWRGP